MQNTTQLYKDLLAANHSVESKLEVYDKDGTELVHTFTEEEIVSMSTSRSLFPENHPSVGGTVSCEIDCELYVGDVTIPRMAMLKPYVRLTSGTQTSEWLPKGVYWIDTRSTDYSSGKMTIHGYDAMLKGEVMFATETTVADYPRTDLQVLNGFRGASGWHDGIAQKLGVTIQQETLDFINKGYEIQFPGTVQGDDKNVKGAAYTVREVLSYIGAMYCGNWIIDEDGTLRLVNLFTYEKLPVGVDFEASWSSDQSMQKYPARPFSTQFNASTSFVVSAINYVKWDASTSFSATFSADVNAEVAFAHFARCVLRALWAERMTGSANPAVPFNFSLGANCEFDVTMSTIIPNQWQYVTKWNDYSTFDTLFYAVRR